MADWKLNSIDSEDIEDWLTRVEKSFNIRFVGRELVDIKTFGELCDHIAHKIPLDQRDDCTTQQAFYKLRTAVTAALVITPVTPATLLTDSLPRRKRIRHVRKLERELGFRLAIVQPPNWVLSGLVILLVASLLSLFISGRVGVFGLLTTTVGWWVANAFGNELSLRTVGEVAQKMARENYLQSRRNPMTYNRNELKKVLTEWFSHDFDIPLSELTRESKFAWVK